MQFIDTHIFGTIEDMHDMMKESSKKVFLNQTHCHHFSFLFVIIHMRSQKKVFNQTIIEMAKD